MTESTSHNFHSSTRLAYSKFSLSAMLQVMKVPREVTRLIAYTGDLMSCFVSGQEAFQAQSQVKLSIAAVQ